LIEQGKIDTTFLISHHAPLEQASEMYKNWHDDQNTYTKIVLKPEMALNAQPAEEKQNELA
jgi:threonine dehydrogenase-like Zn-dependent dehydrogenase